MFAIASLSSGKNGVRSHVVKYKRGTKPLWENSKLAQVNTNDYRNLHKLHNNGNTGQLMQLFDDRPFDHVIDVQSLTLHKKGCSKIGESQLRASIIDVYATNLDLCECLK